MALAIFREYAPLSLHIQIVPRSGSVYKHIHFLRRILVSS